LRSAVEATGRMVMSPLIAAWSQAAGRRATAYSRAGSATMVPLSDANGHFEQ
jgi:hypothetical protein